MKHKPIKTKIETINNKIAAEHRKTIISKIKMIESSASLKENSVEIIGKIMNTGTKVIKDVKISAALIDIEANNFHECSNNLSEVVKPMETINFTINCENISENIKNFVSYDLSIK